MIANLVDYFKPEHQFFLQNVSYRRIGQEKEKQEYSLICSDNIDADIEDNQLHLTVTRNIRFDPSDLFELTVSYGVVLSFNSETKNDVNWDEIDIQEEFKEYGSFVLSNIMNRISLLISQITSSYGQPPIIMPPTFIREN